MHLSKSEYIKFLKHPAWLWLKKHQKHKLPDPDENLQARFETDQLTCISDIIQRVDDNVFDLYEIKSSTRVKAEHKHDLAFQTVVLENSGLEVNDIFVIHVNNDYERGEKIEAEKISNIEKVTDKVRAKIDETKENINKLLR